MSSRRALGRVPRCLLLAAHLLFAAMWLGGIVTLLLLSVAFRAPTSDGALAAVRSAMKLIDHGVIIPACFGSLLSGIDQHWPGRRSGLMTVQWEELGAGAR